MIPVIPVPKNAHFSSEQSHSLPMCVSADSQWRSDVFVLSELFLQIFEATLSPGEGGIELRFDPAVAPNAYILDTGTVACIRASGREGLLYGMASLLQMITISEEKIIVPAANLEDYPDKPFRAFMLDLGFATQPFEKLRKYVDLCFLYLEVRRSKKKGTTQDLRYCMEKDYERCQYPIPDHLAVQIMEYLSATENTYRSDIDVLFCKEAQFAEADVLIESDNHYTYSNLRQCLSYFYRKVIEGQYGYIVVSGHDRLGDGEIGRIQLGDMRHIAMVALAVCGGSPSVCKELAGHDSIEISAHYYSNLTTFLDLLGYERYREIQTSTSNAYGLMASRQYPVANGYCQCEQVWRKDYAPCESAVDADGVPGSCNNCRWYLPTKHSMAARGEKTQKEKAADALQQTCLLLRQAVEQVREGLGCVDTISGILDKLAAQSRQYIHLSAIERIIESEE